MSARGYHLRNNGLISYLQKGKEPEFNESGLWTRTNRVEAKTGKVLRELLTRYEYDFTDKDIEVAANSLKAIADDSYNPKTSFSEVSGDEIRQIYDLTIPINKKAGTLNDSCMNGDGEYMDIYCSNKNVSMVILGDGSELYGRALLWDHKYMDRIYANDVDIEKFKCYARSKGYHFKVDQTFRNELFYAPPTYEEKVIPKRIHLQHTEFDCYPYMDTFKRLHEDGVCHEQLSVRGYIGVCDNTYGGISRYVAVCYVCNDLVGEYNMVNDEVHCLHCSVHDDIADRYILRENAVEYVGGGFTDVDNTVCVEHKFYLLDSEKIRYSGRGAEYYLADCCVKDYNGSWIHESDAVEDGDEYYHNDDKDDFLKRFCKQPSLFDEPNLKESEETKWVNKIY